MAREPVLAHVARRLGRGTEDLATEALVHVLDQPETADALMGLLRDRCPDLPAIVRLSSHAVDAEDGAIPDIAGDDERGQIPLLIEVKLNASLTSNQPGTYLDRLGRVEGASLLAFLVPERRADLLWDQVVRQCSSREAPFTPSDIVHAGRSGSTSVALLTWEQALATLESAVSDDALHSDLSQLRGLYESQERAGSRQLTDDFISGSTGAQILTVTALLEDTLNGLKAEGLAESIGRWAGGPSWVGKAFVVSGRRLHLHVHFRRWGKVGATPLWISVSERSTAAHALLPLERERPRRAHLDRGRLVVPIDLAAATEPDELRRQADAQLREVCSLVAAEPSRVSDGPEVADEVVAAEP